MKKNMQLAALLILIDAGSIAFAQESAPIPQEAKVTLSPSVRQVPLEYNAGLTVSIYSMTALFLTKEADYAGNLQAFSGLSAKSAIGRSFGIYLESTWGKMLPSTFGSSYFRYRGFELLSFSAGPFIDLSLLSNIPGNLQIGITGGAAFGYYRESNALFYFPILEPSCTMYRSSSRSWIAFSGSLSAPIYLKPQALSIGLGFQFGIVFLPLTKESKSTVSP